jgi:hypothetical protein
MAPPDNGIRSWEEVGIEFRMMVFEILHRFRDEIRRSLR